MPVHTFAHPSPVPPPQRALLSAHLPCVQPLVCKLWARPYLSVASVPCAHPSPSHKHPAAAAAHYVQQVDTSFPVSGTRRKMCSGLLKIFRLNSRSPINGILSAPTHVPVSCMYRPPFWVHTSQISAGQGAALALTSGCAYGQLREVLGFAQITVACARSMCAAHHGIIAHVRTVSLCELVSRALMHGAADVGVCDVYMRVHDCTRACLYMCLYTCVCVRVCACCSRLCGPSCLQWQGDMGKG